MRYFVVIMFIVLGLIPLIRFTVKEDVKTFFKIMVGASCGALIIGGTIALIILGLI